MSHDLTRTTRYEHLLPGDSFSVTLQHERGFGTAWSLIDLPPGIGFVAMETRPHNDELDDQVFHFTVGEIWSEKQPLRFKLINVQSPQEKILAYNRVAIFLERIPDYAKGAICDDIFIPLADLKLDEKSLRYVTDFPPDFVFETEPPQSDPEAKPKVDTTKSNSDRIPELTLYGTFFERDIPDGYAEFLEQEKESPTASNVDANSQEPLDENDFVPMKEFRLENYNADDYGGGVSVYETTANFETNSSEQKADDGQHHKTEMIRTRIDRWFIINLQSERGSEYRWALGSMPRGFYLEGIKTSKSIENPGMDNHEFRFIIHENVSRNPLSEFKFLLIKDLNEPDNRFSSQRARITVKGIPEDGKNRIESCCIISYHDPMIVEVLYGTAWGIFEEDPPKDEKGRYPIMEFVYGADPYSNANELVDENDEITPRLELLKNEDEEELA